MKRPLSTIAALSLLLLGSPTPAETPEWIGKRRPTASFDALRAGGSWKTAGARRRPLQRWSLDVVRAEGGDLTGYVVIDDSPLLTRGRVRGRLDGDTVSGIITDPKGDEAVRFTGAVVGGRLRGTFVDRTGETGEWAWDAPLPD
jgi:hypothetical protein